MTKKVNKTMILALCILLLCCTSLAFVLFNVDFNKKNSNPDISVVAASNNTKETFDKYTDSDVLYGGYQGYKIQDYYKGVNDTNDLYRSTSNITASWLKYSLNGGTDDPIVNIVPKSVFANEGRYFHIGKEYGFFAETFKDIYFQDGLHYKGEKERVMHTYVMVFDIVNELDIATNENITISIKPLFQHEYVFLKNSSLEDGKEPTFSIPWQSTRVKKSYSQKVYYSNTPDNLVVPSIRGNGGSIAYYEEIDKYYLSDINMQLSLLNENAPNKGMDGYVDTEDKGASFFAVDYEYNGRTRQGNGFNNNLAVLDRLSVSLGNAMIFSPINSAQKVYQLPEYNYSIDANNNINTPTNFNKYVNNVGFYTPSAGKISTKEYYPYSYPSEYGLIKSANININTTLDNSVWYGTNHYAKGVFKTNQLATYENNRVYRDLAFKVVNKDGVATPNEADWQEPILMDTQSSSYCFNTEEDENNTKDVNINTEQSVLLLPNATNTFLFKPKYSGKYDFDFTKLASNFDIYIGEQLITSRDSLSSVYVTNDVGVTIKMVGNEYCYTGTFGIDVSMATTLNGSDDTYIVKTNNNGMYHMTTNSADVKIAEILKWEENDFYSPTIKEGQSELLNPINTRTDNYDAILTEGEYYIVLNASAGFTNNSIDFSAIRTVSMGNNTVNANNNRSIYKFIDNTTNAPLNISCLAEITGQSNLLQMMNSSFELIDGISYTNKDDDYHKNFTLPANSANNYLIIQTNNSTDSQFNLSIMKAENAVAWSISNDNIERGEGSIEINAKLNGIFDISKFDTKINLTGVNINKKTLTVDRDARLTSGKTVIEVCAFDRSSIFNTYKVNIVEEKLPFNLVRKDGDVYFEIYNPQDIASVTVKFYNSKNSKAFSKTISLGTQGETTREALLDDMIANNFFANGDVTLYADITTINFKPESIFVSNSETNTSKSSRVLFGSGTGSASSAYTLETATDYRNLAMLESITNGKYYYRQTQDVDMQSSPMPTSFMIFGGHLDGGGFKLLNINANSTNAGSSFKSGLNTYKINTGYSYGGLFYALNKNAEIKNFSELKMSVNMNSSMLGGVVDFNYGVIDNIATTGTIKGTDTVGGIAGYNEGKIRKCTNKASVSGYNASGIVAKNYMFIWSNTSTGTLSGSGLKGNICAENIGYSNDAAVPNREISIGYIPSRTLEFDVNADIQDGTTREYGYISYHISITVESANLYFVNFYISFGTKDFKSDRYTTRGFTTTFEGDYNQMTFINPQKNYTMSAGGTVSNSLTYSGSTLNSVVSCTGDYTNNNPYIEYQFKFTPTNTSYNNDNFNLYFAVKNIDILGKGMAKNTKVDDYVINHSITLNRFMKGCSFYGYYLQNYGNMGILADGTTNFPGTKTFYAINK